MSYLIADNLPTKPAGLRFREALDRPGILRLPVAHDGMTAIQAERLGFQALYLSSAARAASTGLPDPGINTIGEVAFFVRQITRFSSLPLLVDGDTGYDEALNVIQMVCSFEDAGAAAVHLQDQILPKKYRRSNNKKLALAIDMATKIEAAVHARRHLFVVARTDAAASEGIEGAVTRAKLYVEAGADAIFLEALTSVEMLREVRAQLPGVRLLANMTKFDRTPPLSAEDFQELGYDMAIWPVSSLRGLCCTNHVGDSSRESSVVAAMYEQTHAPDLQDQELASLQ